ncbi:NADP-dependent oxidoreductase [Oceanicola sp. 22II-s10i]|uniref:NADP-dependent oxidoreductase n=1 Tax=Oceanicola sp. 22II-s10i TaxID=1317116 RepID=UPI000B52853A|nr:NADP-dependent oxidoreductase [Oceanicola sp. 22II-s10i]OWU86286.1 NADP-dependent oxidoreductase [Oceanicola sp. 22II-s10i]
MTKMNRIVLASRPTGAPQDENFRLETAEMPEPGEGEILVQVAYMSLDPYMRGRMDDVKSYAQPVPIGGTMEAGGIGKVLKSNHPNFAPGDYAVGRFGWADHGVIKGDLAFKWDPDMAPLSAGLGVLGMPGFTAWAGITAYGKLKEGETLVVGAATGPVGSMVGQLAKQAGLRAIGVAGGAEKCRMAVETFGFDACIDHRGKDARAMRDALAAECPKGIDVYFENVGGPTLGGVLPLMNLHGRIIVCGMIAWYNGAEDETAGFPTGKLWRMILVNRLTVQGLLQTDHVARFPEFIKEVAPKVKSGEIAYVEDVAEGLENAPKAFMSLLKGGNTGKQVVKISDA